jgi:membrane protein YdbS with pleckstrin-like domain
MFQNDEIDASELPQADSVSFEGMDRNFIRRLQVRAAIALLILVTGIGSLHIILSLALADERPELGLGWLWFLPLFAGIALFAWPLLSVPKRGFALREKDIVYKSGIFWHTVTAVPFNRIQHVEKSSTPLDRRFGVATLQLFTAGGAGGDLKIHGLSAELAESIRTFILDKVGSIVEHD